MKFHVMRKDSSGKYAYTGYILEATDQFAALDALWSASKHFGLGSFRAVTPNGTVAATLSADVADVEVGEQAA